MDSRFLNYYNRELQHIRETAGEFAKDYPKIAGRLGLDSFECADPYVERLLEGFAFLAARVQLKVDSEFSRFTRHLLETIYPNYLCPTPSMAVVQFNPTYSEGSLQKGFEIKKNTKLLSQMGKGDQTACEYRTGQDLTLWPVSITQVEYLANRSLIANTGISVNPGARSGIKITLETVNEIPFNQVPLDELSIYLHGIDEQPFRLYEYILANTVSTSISYKSGKEKRSYKLPGTGVRSSGLSSKDALLPLNNRTFNGYRLFQEYFAFQKRFLFIDFLGLREALKNCDETSLEIIIETEDSQSQLSEFISNSNFKLHCTPVINLFPKRSDRIHLKGNQYEYHVVVDRTRPMDFEVYSVDLVTGHGTLRDHEQAFYPFYFRSSQTERDNSNHFFSVMRKKRKLSTKQKKRGFRSSYIGSEVFISLVDGENLPISSNLKQLSVNTLCTNRDLPIQMPLGVGQSDFHLDIGAPVASIRCVAGPTKPLPSRAHGDTAWRLVSHLTPNYMSISDSNNGFQAAASFREILSLYTESRTPSLNRHIEAIMRIQSDPVFRSIFNDGHISVVRGQKVHVEMDESFFEGSGVFLFAQMIEYYLSSYVSINSFTETELSSPQRGEIAKWPARNGQRQVM